MKELVPLLNIFALLSVLAVGGGTAVLPQMEHETVTVYKWVTPDQFTTIYSLGQLAPGPNMTMVALIGYHAAGVAGFFVVLIAFYFPACLLVYVVSHVWDAAANNPWRESIQKGMAPITIGLMLAGVYAVGKTASFNIHKPLEFNLITMGIGALVVAVLFARKFNPALLILAGGVLGYFILR